MSSERWRCTVRVRWVSRSRSGWSDGFHCRGDHPLGHRRRRETAVPRGGFRCAAGAVARFRRRGSGWANFGANLEALAPHFRCLVLDQPGFGASERPETYDGNYLRIAVDAVLGLLDELGIDTAHLLGNSVGRSNAP
ncbi:MULTISPECIES: alpha/beta fold hydrolase [Nocardia]|uniref:alpha/beta fold hydrolase n=1 Tax=Nocardia TaxID=1817 RepID=UPI001D0C763A|nr:MULTISPECIES: alpha/beta fold hydrolase [Nocardia]